MWHHTRVILYVHGQCLKNRHPRHRTGVHSYVVRGYNYGSGTPGPPYHSHTRISRRAGPLNGRLAPPGRLKRVLDTRRIFISVITTPVTTQTVWACRRALDDLDARRAASVTMVDADPAIHVRSASQTSPSPSREAYNFFTKLQTTARRPDAQTSARPGAGPKIHVQGRSG